MKSKKILKKTIGLLVVILFIAMNVIAIFQAYKFTHFVNPDPSIQKRSKELSTTDKIKILFLGIDNERPMDDSLPKQKFETIKLQSNKTIECWSIKTDSAKGTVILFHGYVDDKSKELNKSDVFLKLGYNTFLVDFMGSGGSEGNQTTIGYKEAEEVKTAYDYLIKSGEKNIYLYGTSMGAAAILKAINDYNIKPKGILIECPYGSLYQATVNRFKLMGVPSFPLAGMLVFWGGIENGFWAFSLKPTDYAKAVTCPTLLMYGGKDQKVIPEETNDIYSNLNGWKELKIYPLSAHEDYLIKYRERWTRDVNTFLKRVSSGNIPSSQIRKDNNANQKSEQDNEDTDAAEVLPQLLHH